MTPLPLVSVFLAALLHSQVATAATTYNLPLIQEALEVIGKDAVKEVTSMINSGGAFSLSSLNLTSVADSNSTSAALKYLTEAVDEDYAKAVAYALVNAAANKVFNSIGSLDLFD